MTQFSIQLCATRRWRARIAFIHIMSLSLRSCELCGTSRRRRSRLSPHSSRIELPFAGATAVAGRRGARVRTSSLKLGAVRCLRQRKNKSRRCCLPSPLRGLSAASETPREAFQGRPYTSQILYISELTTSLRGMPKPRRRLWPRRARALTRRARTYRSLTSPTQRQQHTSRKRPIRISAKKPRPAAGATTDWPTVTIKRD